MKKYVFLLLAASFSLLFTSNNTAAQTSKTPSSNHNAISVLNGAWQTSWDGTAGIPSGKEYMVLNDGFFNNISQDSTGAWRETHGGTYEITGNLYKQKILYSSHPARMGAIHWMEFRMDGDNLYLNYFKKLINPNGEDVTSQMHRMEQKFVRVKKSS